MTVAKFMLVSLFAVVGLCNKILGDDQLQAVPFGTPYHARYRDDFPTFNTALTPIPTRRLISADRSDSESEFEKFGISPAIACLILDERRLFFGYQWDLDVPISKTESISFEYFDLFQPNFWGGGHGASYTGFRIAKSVTFHIVDYPVTLKPGINLITENVFSISMMQHIGFSVETESELHWGKNTSLLSGVTYISDFSHSGVGFFWAGRLYFTFPPTLEKT